MNRFSLVLMLLLFYIAPNTKAQTKSTLYSIDRDYQMCLDKGDDMLGCSKKFYAQMDSMLNVVYNNIRIKINQEQKEALKQDQLQWLKKRNAYFKRIPSESYQHELGKEDNEMIVWDKKAEFVENRVIYLINYKSKRK